MKHRVLFIFLIIAKFSTFAQPINCIDIEYNIPRHKDLISRTEFSEFIYAKHGNNILWDLSNAQLKDKRITLRYSVNKGTIITNENGERLQSILIGDSLFMTAQTSAITNLRYYIPELTIKYPMRYGDTVSGYFFGEGTLDFNRYMRKAGYAKTEIIGNGGLITPDCDSLSNVLLVKQTKRGYLLLDETFDCAYSRNNNPALLSPDSIRWHINNDSSTFVTEIYRWFANGYRYPIVETIKTLYLYDGIAIDSALIALYHSPTSQIQDIENDDLNEYLRSINSTQPFDLSIYSAPNEFGIKQTKQYGELSSTNINNVAGRTNEKIGLSYCSVYPTIVTDNTILTYNADIGERLNIMLFSITGTKIWQYDSTCETTTGTIECPMSQLINGKYLIIAHVGSKLYSFKIIKRHGL